MRVWLLVQRLARPVTQISNLSTDQRLYMICEKCGPNRSRILGGMKVGKKKLMMRKVNGANGNLWLQEEESA